MKEISCSCSFAAVCHRKTGSPQLVCVFACYHSLVNGDVSGCSTSFRGCLFHLGLLNFKFV